LIDFVNFVLPIIPEEEEEEEEEVKGGGLKLAKMIKIYRVKRAFSQQKTAGSGRGEKIEFKDKYDSIFRKTNSVIVAIYKFILRHHFVIARSSAERNGVERRSNLARISNKRDRDGAPRNAAHGGGYFYFFILLESSVRILSRFGKLLLRLYDIKSTIS